MPQHQQLQDTFAKKSAKKTRHFIVESSGSMAGSPIIRAMAAVGAQGDNQSIIFNSGEIIIGSPTPEQRKMAASGNPIHGSSEMAPVIQYMKAQFLPNSREKIFYLNDGDVHDLDQAQEEIQQLFQKAPYISMDFIVTDTFSYQAGHELQIETLAKNLKANGIGAVSCIRVECDGDMTKALNTAVESRSTKTQKKQNSKSSKPVK